MRNLIIILLLLLVLLFFSFPQEIIENPEKPENPKAGRILKLEEVLRITETEGEFFFKRPSLIQIADNGNIFLVDAEQFLKFTQDGKFIKNLLKQGQGPGEIQRFTRYTLQDKSIYVYDFGNSKILHMDQEGNMIEEFKLIERYSQMIGMIEDNFIFTKMNYPEMDEMAGKVADIPTSLLILSKEEEIIREYPNVPEKMFLG